jgi:hypothetical protein
MFYRADVLHVELQVYFYLQDGVRVHIIAGNLQTLKSVAPVSSTDSINAVDGQPHCPHVPLKSPLHNNKDRPLITHGYIISARR